MPYNIENAVRRGRSRAIARVNGDKFYIPDKPCPSGHLTKRYTAHGQCLDCLKISKEKHRNTEKFKKTSNEYSSYYSRTHKQRLRAKFYGLTEDQFNKMKTDQKGLCKICENEFGENPRNMHIDHCHKTNKVRGLLCHNCNVGLGKFKDDTSLMQKAIKYLCE